jgi:hypothetical protein
MKVPAYEFAARIARAEVGPRSKTPSADLRAVQKEAGTLGFKLLERKAKQL